MDKPSVYLAVPNYSGNIWHETVASLVGAIESMRACGWSYALKIAPYDCMVHSVRNKMVSDFWESGASHLFFIDDDIAFPPEAVMKVVSLGAYVAGGAVPIRGGDGVRFAPFSSNPGPDNTVDGLGGAFMCIHREAVGVMFQQYPDLRCYEYGKFGHRLFEIAHENGILHGEDLMFCKRWRMIGGKIHLVPDITFRHRDVAVKIGNFNQGAKP
jgi:hypothetical protein